MKASLKRLVNGLLAAFELRLIRAHKGALTGRYPFEDLGMLISTDSPVCMDIGANTGQTIDALLQAFGSPVIHSFEPATATFNELRSKSYPETVYLHNYGIGSTPGELGFRNYRESVLSSFLDLAKTTDNPFVRTPLLETEKVQIDTVDRFLDKHGIEHLHLLKSDTQGYELEVLAGAYASLVAGRISHVLLEVNFIKLYEGQASAIDVFKYLLEAGFQPVDFYEKAMRHQRMAWCTALFSRA
jgi:FkbM family methyltransferase